MKDLQPKNLMNLIMSNIAMNKPIDYEEKRKRKILSNGKLDVSVYQGGPFTVVPRRALNDKRLSLIHI